MSRARQGVDFYGRYPLLMCILGLRLHALILGLPSTSLLHPVASGARHSPLHDFPPVPFVFFRVTVARVTVGRSGQ
ncbi:hypothetical protein EV702DRAFT_1153119 [Suillus placidus]|uniref:Uncharacterized protein n=1 Tax=Suillus placidus TaxID=48579 RepID=A0A9P6ZG82_9AGAM|nr:hypothetical protein EV702DRAFT_1153119 [Suillus placidus]